MNQAIIKYYKNTSNELILTHDFAGDTLIAQIAYDNVRKKSKSSRGEFICELSIISEHRTILQRRVITNEIDRENLANPNISRHITQKR